ncbi:hypothetical protein Pmani_019748 [Petrolisthes manimaculis]|uniref:Uncharacterized protein n=1 Tax=Petrolisthes manimaculis TaxID=1843537 RepID=A0AAE1PI91_9EUCA|nr:hypothetical protein Pmani_019748 [Petrolisthes manimaculis]
MGKVMVGGVKIVEGVTGEELVMARLVGQPPGGDGRVSFDLPVSVPRTLTSVPKEIQGTSGERVSEGREGVKEEDFLEIINGVSTWIANSDGGGRVEERGGEGAGMRGKGSWGGR